jgi:hypothetical protein
MADFNDIEAMFSSRQGAPIRYLCELNSKLEMWQGRPDAGEFNVLRI